MAARSSDPKVAGARFALRSALFFTAAAVLMTWPMAVSPNALFSGRQDYYLNVWNLHWVAEALRSDAEIFHTAMLFHPRGTGLESQPFSLIQSIPSAPIVWLFGPLAALNALIVFAFAFAGWAASVWIADRVGDPVAAVVGGVVYAFAPFHYIYVPEMNLVATGFLPLYLWTLRRMCAAPTPARGALAGLALAAVALGSWYYAVAAGLVAAATCAWLVFTAGTDRVRALGSVGVHAGVTALVLLPVVAVMWPAFANAPETWGKERAGLGLVMPDFKGTGTTVGLWALAGWTTLLLAAMGMVRWPARVGLAALFATFALLSFGSALQVGDAQFPLPFAALEDMPGAGAFRYPDRFFAVALLALAGLAAYGVADARERLGTNFRRPAAALFLILPLLEFWPGMLLSVQPIPSLPQASTLTRPGAVLDVPTTLRNLDGEAMFAQTRHGRALCGGYLTRVPAGLAEAQRSDAAIGPSLARRPGQLDEAWVGQLRDAGIGYVVLRRAPLAPGRASPADAETERRFFGPLSVSGRPFLQTRLFPQYPQHDRLPEIAGAWQPVLRRLLGDPVAEYSTRQVFEVPQP